LKTLHRLRERKKLLDYEFCVFDIETNGLIARPNKFIFGVIYNGITFKTIYSVKDFIAEFQKPKYKKKIIFAHNAEFDLTCVYGHIIKKLDRKAIFNGRFISATNGNCKFADSYNIFPGSVKKIGDIINLPKLDIEGNYTTGKVTKISAKMIKYCERDCEIIYKALLEIFTFVGNVKITIGSLTLDLYRRKFQPFNIDFNEDICSEFFNSYYGGRVEAFKIGKTNSLKYDVNSMYSYVMANCIFPNPKFLKQSKDISYSHFMFLLKNYEGCAELSITHLDSYFGFLPFKYDSQLLFPNGNFKAFWNFNELRFALKNKILKINKIHKIYYSTINMKSPFKEFVNVLYDIKVNATNDLKREQTKLFLNNLYGKFAQREKFRHTYSEFIDTDKIEKYQREGKYIDVMLFSADRSDCYMITKGNGNMFYHSIPLFSSYITSSARILLLQKLLQNYNNNITYCDTDSIFCEQSLNENSNEIGKFKLENGIVKEIRGLKNYTIIENNEIIDKIKGVPRTAEYKNNHYLYINLMKTKESIRRNLVPGIPTKRIKKLKKIYDKRNILNYETKPIIL